RPMPPDSDPLRNNPRRVVYQIDRIGLLKDFWARNPSREPEDLYSRRIFGDLLAAKAVALAQLGKTGPAERLAGQAVAGAERLTAGPSRELVLPATAQAVWGVF